MASRIEISGTSSKRFAPVREMFARNFRRGELGASLCVWHKGEFVVDLWGGTRDKERKAPWESDTVATVFSSTKGVVALAVMMLAHRGLLDYDAPVATYWPQFATHGKEDITVRTLMNHRAGIIGLGESLTLDMIENDADEVAALLARQQPHWAPGSDQGYHGVTFGLYVAELFRRIAGESLGSFIAREIAEPLGASFFLGLPPEVEHRVATNYPVTPREALTYVVPKLLLHRGTDGRVYRNMAFRRDTAKAFIHPAEVGPRGVSNFNTTRVRKLELPWGNGIANARALVRIYAVLANGGQLDGVELVSKSAIEALHQRQSWSTRDRVLCKPVGWSQGFLKETTKLFSPNAASFGHAGSGGSLGWCDPDAGLAIGYVMNKMDHRIRSARALRLCKAIYDCL